MRPIELLVIYLLIGGAVALALHRNRQPGVALSLPLWPLFLPNLLTGLAPAASPPRPRAKKAALPMLWRTRIDGATRELRHALNGWPDLPTDTSSREATLASVARGLETIALRLAQLDGVLSQPELSDSTGGAGPSLDDADGLRAARQANIDQLTNLRNETYHRLERALASMAELSTRVHLARFRGDAGDEVAQQLARLATAIDSAGEVSRIAPPIVGIERLPG